MLSSTLSFILINRFSNEGSMMTFYLHCLSTGKVSAGTEVNLYVYLILKDGTFNSTLQTATCGLESEVNPNSMVQAIFACSLSGIDSSKEYTYFRLSYSDSVAGIPHQETLLDPVKTAEAIENGYLLNYTIKKNEIKFPIMFNSNSINTSDCLDKGEFIITSNTSIEIKKRVSI